MITSPLIIRLLSTKGQITEVLIIISKLDVTADSLSIPSAYLLQGMVSCHTLFPELSSLKTGLPDKNVLLLIV